MQATDELDLTAVLDDAFATVRRVVAAHQPALHVHDVGTVSFVGPGIAQVRGLPGVRSEELVLFPDQGYGMAFNIDPDEVGVVLLDESPSLRTGLTVRRTGRVQDVPVGDALIGRVVDPVGRPLDNRGPVPAMQRRPVERESPAVMDRDPVTVPLQTGLKAVDALIPVGRGQRELIVGDRQTGKTAVALDTIINQNRSGNRNGNETGYQHEREQDVLCIYCAIGQRTAATAKVIADLRAHNAMRYSVVVVASGEDPPGLQFAAPYAATSIGEYFMEQGRDVLVVYDDLTRHARAYRELSLLLRRPPGREAFPGDIFYIHSRLLERSTHLRAELGGGSLTALPIVETEAQNIAAYIPTNLISITDGQIYLSPDLFQKGVLPAVDIGRSVSRVGGKTQLAAYRAVAGDLRLSYAQFEELEAFSRFSSRLDEHTRQVLERGYRVREVLKQPQYAPIPAVEQIAVLLAVVEGVFDGVPVEAVGRAEQAIRRAVAEQLPGVCQRIEAGDRLSQEDRTALHHLAREVVDGA
ncbi:MAG: alternate F1F0 ATPase, F1 subunit alpha [Chloroflexaceae bacterium]|nr:alternate F1F0 ATPase, F1 subunit alpha [Chloroflexaceae bacterium]